MVRCSGIILQPLASSEAVLTNDEKELGVCLVDIGGGTTDIAIIKNAQYNILQLFLLLEIILLMILLLPSELLHNQQKILRLPMALLFLIWRRQMKE